MQMMPFTFWSTDFYDMLQVTEKKNNRADTFPMFSYSKNFLLHVERRRSPLHLDHLSNETSCTVAECAFCISLPNLLRKCQEYKKKFNLTELFWPWIVSPLLMLLEQQYCSLRLREILAAWSSQRPNLAGEDKQAHQSETLEESLELLNKGSRELHIW